MAFCPNCGSALGEGMQFCGNCGQPMGQPGPGTPQNAVPPQGAAPPPPAPGAPYAPYAPPYAPGQQQYAPGMYAPPPKPRKGNGLWIGLASALLVVVVACVLVFVVFKDDIFKGDGESASSSTTAAGQTKGDEPTPSAVMAKAAASLGTSESQTGSFELKISVDADTSQLPADQAAIFKDPWIIGGTVAYQNATQAGDFTVSLSMMGQSMDVAIKTLGDKAWIGLGGQWYEAPPDTQQQLADSGISSSMTQVQQMMNDLSIDPTTWLIDQAPVKEEKMDGVAVYHLSGTNPDWAKIVGDLTAVTQSDAFNSLMSNAGSTASSLEAQLPSAEELQQTQDQLAALFSDVKIDLWLEKDTGVLRKLTFAAKIVPPAAGSTDTTALGGLDLSGSGIKGMGIEATLELNPNQPVTVEAPSSALTYEEFQAAIENDPSLLGPLGSMLMGGGLQ